MCKRDDPKGLILNVDRFHDTRATHSLDDEEFGRGGGGGELCAGGILEGAGPQNVKIETPEGNEG